MQRSLLLLRTRQLAILGATMLCITLAAPTVFAQTAAATAAPLEEVYVTGSRIARDPGFEGSSPVELLNREEIANSGYTNLQQLLEKLPSTGNGTFSTRGNNQDSTANGTAAVSLRGLGADATLVLVNGRRVTISSFAQDITTNFVDINSIPVAAIERIEVLKDGASALYGSDAVAGVVNIITRRNYVGSEVTAHYGATTKSGNDELSLSAIWGTGSGDANVTAIFDYFRNSTLGNAERGTLGSANQTAQGGEDFRSSRGYPGRFVVDGVTKIDPSCPVDRRAGQTCLYDYGPWNLLMPASERVGFMLLGHQKFGDNIEAFTEVGVQHNTSIAQGAPTPLDDTAGLTVPVTNPGNPFPGATSISIARYRTVDAGPRRWDIASTNLRLVAGLRGKMSEWDWEVSAQRARSDSTQSGDRSMGWVRTDFLQQEINAGRYNPFGATQNPQSVIDAITTSLVRRGKSDLTTIDAGLNGRLFDLAGRAVRMAAGAEYRKESVADIPDDQFQRGLIFGTEAVSAAASRNNSSAYVEFSVPVLASLELSLAGRYDHYSDFGNTTNPKVAVRWAVTDDLALRASWGTGFRAPSLAQVGLGPSQGSQFFSDNYGCAVNPAYCATTDYTLVFSGNRNLKPEKSTSYNFGLAWKAMDQLRFTLDFWKIKQKEKIDQVPFGFLYTLYCDQQNSTVCVRGAPLGADRLGPLQSINTSFINIGEQSVQGVDLSATYSTDVGIGKLEFGLDYSKLLKFERVELNADGTALVTRALTGEYKYPKDRLALNGDWTRNAWGIHGALNYIGSFEDTPDFDFDGTLDYDTHKSRMVGAFTTLNLQARYAGFRGTTLTLGLDNALDKKPPFAIGDGDVDLYGYVSSQHDPRGRLAYAKVTYKF